MRAVSPCSIYGDLKFSNSDVPSVLERPVSFPTALPVSLQSSLLCNAFAMFSLEVLCPWSFPTVAGASQTSAELRSLLRSSPVFARAPPCLPEFLLLPWSPFPSEFFGDSSRTFPCLLRAFLLSPMTLLLHHSFAVL